MSEFDLSDAERMLATSPEHRVLKRVPPVVGWPLATETGPTRRALFIDVKTTGGSIQHDQIMALGSLAFSYDAKTGAIVEVDDPWGFEDPEPDAIEALAEGVDLVIAHRAVFVRPLVEKLAPVFLDKNWACSHDEIAWAGECLWPARIEDHLAQLGWFIDSHEVADRARGGAFLMSLMLPRSERTVLSALLANARRPRMAVRAVLAPRSCNDALRLRGYYWDPGFNGLEPAWWILRRLTPKSPGSMPKSIGRRARSRPYRCQRHGVTHHSHGAAQNGTETAAPLRNTNERTRSDVLYRSAVF